MTRSVKEILWGETDDIRAGARLARQVGSELQNTVYYATEIPFDEAVYWPIVDTMVARSEQVEFGLV